MRGLVEKKIGYCVVGKWKRMLGLIGIGNLATVREIRELTFRVLAFDSL